MQPHSNGAARTSRLHSDDGITIWHPEASATVPSRLTKASPPFCCGSVRFMADACGIFAEFGLSKPRLPSPAFAEGSAVGDAAAEKPASCGSFLPRVLPSEVGVIGEPAGASLPITATVPAEGAHAAAVSQL
ncbi:hypothetical protein EYF80_017928 [Liparis tanakae]|uniref:Uncharacterized protein n=1 Tax=Liparis tanakae TaxID=230148 RepID=A0A4Z2I2B6_9TELE|nr:hypothetical protein EYF80_017928 [Liparis tanakae]